MDTVNDHIHTLLDGNPSSSALDSIHDSLADGLFSELREQAWFPQQAEEWGKRVAGESALQISTRIRELKDRHLDSATIRRIMADFSQNPISAIFLTPEAVRTIYSDSPPEFGALIQEGADYHCRIIRRAVSQAVRRHIAGMKRASLDVRELEEELVGMVMEETVRCLSDLSARVWKKNNPVPVVFPSEGARGMRHGILTRVALSKDGGRLAAVRSDRCLFVWDIGNRELLHTWDISLLDDLGKTDTLESLFFSTDGWRIALETVNRQVVTLNLNDETASIHGYRETDREAFYKEFGSPFIPRRTAIPENGFLIQTRLGKSVSLSQYSGCVFDWACDSRFQTVAAASERERAMPEWMRKAGFERAVYHIAQRRLIDLIRKRTHTQYACWRCGSMISSFSDTQCRRCGADFTQCPIGCKNAEPLGPANRWQCPRCGMTTRAAESALQVEMGDWHADPQSTGSEWRDSHDMERILHVLQNVSLAYKKIEIPCGRLVVLKAEGKTNEEIGVELGIPRGSVDYIWNQCKQRILYAFGEG